MLALIGLSEYTPFSFSRVREPYVRRLLAKRAIMVLAVTVLTSLDSNALSEIGLDPNIARQARRFANMANQAGLRGLVCSPLEVAELRQALPVSMQFVTPGVRLEASPDDDQRRTLSPRDALAAGANWLVIGRPIYAAPDPRAAADAILNSLG